MSDIQICYISAAAESPVETATLKEILDVSRRNNDADRITGLLITLDDVFLQILEGDDARVRACLGRIRQDPRHKAFHLIGESPCPERSFADWAMAHRHIAGAMVDDGMIDMRTLTAKVAEQRARLGPLYTFLRSFCRTNSREEIILPA